jgi:C4-dicarboxylate-specific signal transduction histidine kinase
VEANELAFFGKISAGVTHELKNVLAVINESNGLMADFLEMLKQTPFAYREKFQRSIGRIEEQVRRGVVITTSFNRFAHSTDSLCVQVDLNEIIEGTVLLTARFTRLRDVGLKASVSTAPIKLYTNAFRLRMSLTRAIEALSGCMRSGGSILVSAQSDVDPPSLELSYEGEPDREALEQALAVSGEWLEFEELASVLGIRYQWQTSRKGLAMFFSNAPADVQNVDSKQC